MGIAIVPFIPLIIGIYLFVKYHLRSGVKREQVVFEILHYHSITEGAGLFFSVFYAFMASVFFTLVFCGRNNLYLNPKGPSADYYIVLFVFSFALFILAVLTVDLKLLRKMAEEFKAGAKANKDERTEEYRKKLVRENKEKILNDAEAIQEKHSKIFSNTKRVEYFKNFGGREVIRMWEEDFKRYLLASSGALDVDTDTEKEQPEKSEKEIIQEKTSILKEIYKKGMEGAIETHKRAEVDRVELTKRFGPEVADKIISEVLQAMKDYNVRGL